MATVLLVRHGLTAWTGPVLAGWTPGVHLDDRGREQAASLARRLVRVPLGTVVTSPLERCRETADAIVAGREGATVTADERLGECRYGDWTGQHLRKLAKDPLWQVVQAHPSAATFPGDGGESLLDTQHRAVQAIRDWNGRLNDGTYLVCSHGDVIKAIVADALGLHLDLFQRIQVDPCSLTVIRYTDMRPFVVRLNDTGGGIDDLVPPKAPPREGWRRWMSRKRESDAAVGGGSGSA